MQNNRKQLQPAGKEQRSSAELPHQKVETTGKLQFFPTFSRETPPNHNLNKFSPRTSRNQPDREELSEGGLGSGARQCRHARNSTRPLREIFVIFYHFSCIFTLF